LISTTLASSSEIFIIFCSFGSRHRVLNIVALVDKIGEISSNLNSSQV